MNTALFKQQVESITLQDVACLKTVKADKTLNTHLERFKKGKFTKNEINALKGIFSSYRFAKPERKLQIEALQGLILKYAGHEYIHGNFQGDIMHFTKPCKITKEQTDLGKAWLKNHFFKLNGDTRNGQNTDGVSDRVLSIARKVKRFEFIGLMIVKNAYGDINECLPIYRTFDSKGQYFDYSPIHWGQPIIMEGY